MEFENSFKFPMLGSHAMTSAFITHRSLFLRDARDAHIVLEAVRQNLLPLVRRRLAVHEREQLVSGNVYVWEESQDDGLLIRWTDGRKWSQSRMRGDYLFYEEKVDVTAEERREKALRRQRRVSDLTSPANSNPMRRKDRPSKPNGLTKQTYSALVNIPGLQSPRKWHVVAYFSGDDYTRLPIIDSYDYLKSISVPDGIFVSTKISIRPDRINTNIPSLDRKKQPSDDEETRSSYESPHSPKTPNSTSSRSTSVTTRRMTSRRGSIVSVSSSSSPITSLSPRQRLRSLTSSPVVHQTWPSIAKMPKGPIPTRRNSSATLSNPITTSHQYKPLSTEDRRVLDKFKIVL